MLSCCWASMRARRRWSSAKRLVARRVEAGELGVHQVAGARPRAGVEVEADQGLAGVAVAGVAGEGALVEEDRLADRHEALLEELGEGGEGGRHGAGIAALEVVDPQAHQDGALARPVELGVEDLELGDRALVVRLGLEEAGERVRGGGAILDSIKEELGGLAAQLGDLGALVDAGGVEDEQGGEAAPIFSLAQAAAERDEVSVADRAAAEGAELFGLARGLGRQGARQVEERGGRGSSGFARGHRGSSLIRRGRALGQKIAPTVSCPRPRARPEARDRSRPASAGEVGHTPALVCPAIDQNPPQRRL
jgi:hypothetical protein